MMRCCMLFFCLIREEDELDVTITFTSTVQFHSVSSNKYFMLKPYPFNMARALRVKAVSISYLCLLMETKYHYGHVSFSSIPWALNQDLKAQNDTINYLHHLPSVLGIISLDRTSMLTFLDRDMNKKEIDIWTI